MTSRSLNKVTLIGNLTREPNFRYTPNKTAVCSFGVATNRDWLSSEGGEKKSVTEYHNIVSWSKLAEICQQLLHKGDKVYVEGRLQTREWKTQEGDDKRITEVVIDNMILLHSANRATDGARDNRSPAEEVVENKVVEKPVVEDQVVEKSSSDVADDVPF
jgi:single-strand DNA-binding protein